MKGRNLTVAGDSIKAFGHDGRIAMQGEEREEVHLASLSMKLALHVQETYPNMLISAG